MSSKKADIVAIINFSGHMTTEQAHKWAESVERTLRVSQSLPEGNTELKVTLVSVTQPEEVDSEDCQHVGAVPHAKDFPGKGMWCPTCRMDIVA